MSNAYSLSVSLVLQVSKFVSKFALHFKTYYWVSIYLAYLYVLLDIVYDLPFFVNPGNQDASFFSFCPLKLKLKHKQTLVLSEIIIGALNNQLKHILYEYW